MVSEDLRRQMA